MNNYKLRLFTRPYNIGAGWKMFKAWRLHEGMTAHEIILWYYPNSEYYIREGYGTKEKPICVGGDFEFYVGEIE